MYNLALKAEVTVMAIREDWPSYVRRITGDAKPRDIAHAAHINVSLVNRWFSGESRPTSESVVAVARAFHADPVAGLVAAGYIDETDVGDKVEIVQSLGVHSDDELLAELCRRLAMRHDKPQHPVPVTITRSPYAGQEDAGVGGDEERDKRHKLPG